MTNMKVSFYFVLTVLAIAKKSYAGGEVNKLIVLILITDFSNNAQFTNDN